MRLKKLIVKNFKSLHDCEIELGKFNVLIGVNASGKSNLVEIFKLLRKIYVEKDSNPFLEWWGYNNVVWQRKEELPITIGMLFDVEGYDVYFETTFTGTGGRFQILREILDIRGYVKIEKEGQWIRVEHDEVQLKKVLPIISKIKEHLKNNYIIPDFLRDDFFRLNIKNLKRLEIQIQDKENLISLISVEHGMTLFLKEFGFGVNSIHEVSPLKALIDVAEKGEFSRESILYIINPIIPNKREDLPDTLLTKFRDEFYFMINHMIVLKPLIINFIKTPQYPKKENRIYEDGSNLTNILYTIWLREGRLPEEIEAPLRIIFPNTRVFFQLMEDGRVTMKVFENGLELAPPSISDGFYKVLALLTAVYLKPPLLIIDEIENSLHPETLELILDTIKESDVQAIITTHSPVVVDMTEPADLILVDKERGETKFKRIREPEKIKKFLQERGLALSEGWLYGSIFENNESH